MALNKSKNNDALTVHVLVYSLTFLFPYGLSFFILTFFTHWITDYFTSRITSKLWFFKLEQPGNLVSWKFIPGRRHWFFVMIGFDQFIHFVTLAVTYRILFGG